MNFYSIARKILQHKSLKKLFNPGRVAVKKYWEWKYKGNFTGRMDHMHRVFFHKPLNLENPQTMYDKIIWMTLNTDISEWTRLTDKVEVRNFVRSRGLEHILNPVYKVWDTLPSYDEFVAALPRQCVVKTTHTGGSEGVFIIHDKDTHNLRAVYKKLTKSFKDPYAERTGHIHYTGIPHRIMVEKLIADKNAPLAPISDYKFFCINGEPEAINIIAERNIATHQYLDQYFDVNMNRYPWEGQINQKMLTGPTRLPELTAIARTLAQGFPFVRVDLYEVNGEIIFGEMTFTPGFDLFNSSYGDKVLKWGERIDLSLAKAKA